MFMRRSLLQAINQLIRGVATAGLVGLFLVGYSVPCVWEEVWQWLQMTTIVESIENYTSQLSQQPHTSQSIQIATIAHNSASELRCLLFESCLAQAQTKSP
jgi:hypothetical protein